MQFSINIDISVGESERATGREAARGLADELRRKGFN